MGLECGPVCVEEVAVVDQALYTVVDSTDVPVVLILPRHAEGSLGGGGVQEGRVPDLRAVAVVQVEC